MSDIVLVSIALLGILVFVLGANVTRHRAIRGEHGPQIPTDPADKLWIAQRAHGNAAEYVPTLIGLLILSSTVTGGWWLDTLAMAALGARVLHAIGMLTSKSVMTHGPVRDVGATLTYATGLALGVTAVIAI
jgi:uncharacterized membrane protein YecN with MAPEG domain